MINRNAKPQPKPIDRCPKCGSPMVFATCMQIGEKFLHGWSCKACGETSDSYDPIFNEGGMGK
ncbi:MAG: hypothetical protein ACYDG4_13335 [Desulfuromonadaceae bacterium]